MTTKHKVAIIGYGNIGKYAVQAIEASPDLELVGVVRRSVEGEQPLELTNVPVVTSIRDLKDVEVAILCTPTRSVEQFAKECLELGIHTVDSFDIHNEIVDLRHSLDEVAKKHNSVAIVSAGWDPGTDSMIRTMLEFMAPKGITNTNFGPGMSMGHTVAVKAVEGVKEALSVTIPLGTSIHRRMVYIEVEEGVEFQEVKERILNDPYFMTSETHIFEVDNVDELIDRGHAVSMERKGVSGATQNQLFSFEMKINNPALTSQNMIAAARATLKQNPGAYTMIEVPVIDFIAGDRDELINRLV